MLTPVCWEGWQHPAITPARKCKYFCMQKIDVTPSVEMLRACFESDLPFRVSFKGGIKIQAQPLEHEFSWKWRLTRLRHDTQTSWLEVEIAVNPFAQWDFAITGDEPVAVAMAKAMCDYHKTDSHESWYMAHLVTLYGSKVANITSVER